MKTPLLDNSDLLLKYYSLPKKKKWYYDESAVSRTERCYLTKGIIAECFQNDNHLLYDFIWWIVNYNLLIKVFYTECSIYLFVQNYISWKLGYHFESCICYHNTKILLDENQLFLSKELSCNFEKKSEQELEYFAIQLIDAFKEVCEKALLDYIDYKILLKNTIDSGSFKSDFNLEANTLSSKYYLVLKERIHQL